MASLRDIRRRIKSIKNTAQITKAMQMVAASKMRKAQEAALNGRPYALLLNRVLVSLRNRIDQNLHPLLEKRDVKNEMVVLLSTDKGLCGALNTNLFREAATFDTQKTKFISVGRKGTQFLARTKRNMIADFPLKERPTFLETKAISKFFIERFLSGDVDKVTVLFPRFVNTLTQQPVAIDRGIAQRSGGRAHRIDRHARRPPDPRHLRIGLAPPPLAEQLPVDLQLDSRGAKPVGDRERKRRRHDGAADAERTRGTHADLNVDLGGRTSLAEQLATAECFFHQQLQIRRYTCDPRLLQSVRNHRPAPARLQVEERVTDREGHLVPEIR